MKIAIIYHSESGNTKKMADLVRDGCLTVEGTEARCMAIDEVDDVYRGMGIVSKPTLYDVDAASGAVLGRRFVLTVRSEDGGFAGRIRKTTDKTLPIHLPVFVEGLNRRWDAIVYYPGKVRLHTPDYFRDQWGAKTWAWIIGHYRDQTDVIRYIPVLDDGVGYCQVDTDRQDPDVFIGHPLLCDRPEVFLTLVTAERGKCTFEINNPTDKPMRCRVRPSGGFDLVGRFVKEVNIPAGGFKSVTVVTEMKGENES